MKKKEIKITIQDENTMNVKMRSVTRKNVKLAIEALKWHLKNVPELQKKSKQKSK